MKTVNYVIVEIDELYKKTEGDIIISDSIENVNSINRVSTVISAPSFTILEKGDKIITHHNVFRKKYTATGVQINSNFWIEGNKYFVPLTEIFMFKRDSDWKSINPFCFIEPISIEQSGVGFNISDFSHKDNLKQIGNVLYSNQDLEKLNIVTGDKIIFSKNSEYEFNIDGQLCYKMTTRDILGKI